MLRKSSMVVMSFILLCFLAPPLSYAASTNDPNSGGEAISPSNSSQDDFDVLRNKWKEHLTGGTNYDSTDPDISAYIEKQVSKVTNKDGTGYWDTMNHGDDQEYLWDDVVGPTPKESHSYLVSSYSRLKTMALAYTMKGSSLYHKDALRDDILYGLDWMYDHQYNETISESGNWWEWEIGTPKNLNDTLVLMWSDLSSEQIDDYMRAIDHFVPKVDMTGANRADKALIVAIRGILGKDSEKLAEARDSLSPLFPYVTDDDGFYKDGSFIQHDRFAYTGSYGVVLINSLTKVLNLLSNSPWEVTDPNVDNVYQWVFDSYEPIVHKGYIMDMVRGRAISREGGDKGQARDLVTAILHLSQSAPEPIQSKLKGTVKYWIENTAFDFVSGLPIDDIVMVHSLLSDETIQPRGELTGNYQFAAMDRVVHRRPGWNFGISMFSNRIQNYESINNENLKGWYTGSGMTYLYNNDQMQYHNDFWPTVDPFRLPGVTTDGKPKRTTRNYESWVGGASMNDRYGATGMTLEYPNSTLWGRKSWFMLDDEVVALGAGITSSDDRSIETVAENRMLNDNGNNTLTVNGEEKSSDLGWTKKMTDVKWAHLEGNTADSDIGYYFPGEADVKGVREARTGSWHDINQHGSDQPITRNYMKLLFEHGVKPDDASYAYVLLPNKSVAETKAYSQNPDMNILKNTENIQAVQAKDLGLTAVNFWKAGTMDFIRTQQPASVIVKEKDNELTLSVSDPTQKQDEVNVALAKTGVNVMNQDNTVEVLQKDPYIKVKVDVSDHSGKAHQVKLKYNPQQETELPTIPKLEMKGVHTAIPGDSIDLHVKVTNTKKDTLPAGDVSIITPQNWKLSTDQFSLPELGTGENYTKDITITIPASAQYGSYSINANVNMGDTVKQMTHTIVLPDGLKPVKKITVHNKTHKIDANLDEVKGLDDVGDFSVASGSPNEEANMWITYDDSYLYLSAKVKDEDHFQESSGSRLWAGDAIQWGVTKTDADPTHVWDEFAIALTPDGPQVTKTLEPTYNPKGLVKGAKVDIRRNEETKKTIYEAAIPWSELEVDPGDGAFATSLAVVNYDHGSANGSLEWSGGILGGKDIQQFATATLAQPSASVEDMKVHVKRFEENGEIKNHGIARALRNHLTKVGHYEKKGAMDKAIKQMNHFKKFINHHTKNGIISDQAHDSLLSDANELLEKWQ